MTKLPPCSTIVPLHRDETFKVLQGRCRFAAGYGNARGGYVKILVHRGMVDGTEDAEVYVPRELLTHV